MNFTYKFDKMLDLREREKQEAALSYQKSVDQFEEVAEKLYLLLKKKEGLESAQLEKIQTGLSVHEIRLNQYFLSQLQRDIDYFQRAVIVARQKMQQEEKRLLEKNIEVKKLEKLKDKEYERFIERLNREEEKKTDEISMQIVAREKTV